MTCPRCETGLVSKNVFGVEVETCASCKGIFFDLGELEEVLEHGSVDEIEKFEIGGRVRTARGVISCSKCSGRMMPRQYAYMSRVKIDHCMNCHSVWLDGGELSAISKSREQIESAVEKDSLLSGILKALSLK